MPTGLGDEKLWLCPTLDDSADDISGNNHHGTYNGGMGTVADTNVGGTKAYSFDGTDDFINCGSSIDTTAPLSVSCWFNSDQVRNFQGLVSRSASSSFPNFILYTHGSSEVGTYISAHRRTSSLVATGNWYHTCFTLDANGNLDLYFNGSLVRSDTSVSMSYSAAFDLLIGDFQSATGSDYPHDGLMDDIRIFGRVLSETEIDHLGTSRGIEGNPYQFNGLGDEKLWLCPSLNDSADDLSGNGNHGAYTGTIATVADTSNGGVRAYEIGTATGYIDLDRPSGIADVVAPLSISCWIYINGNNSMKTIWGAYQSTWSGYLYSLLRIDSDYLTYFSVSTGGAYISKQESSSYSQQTWFHIAVTMDSSGNIKFYRNGTLATTDQFTNLGLSYPLQSSVKFYLGANQAQTNSEHFEGRIDDFRWFGDVLTEDEITALASKRGYRNLTGPHPHPLTVAIEHPLG